MCRLAISVPSFTSRAGRVLPSRRHHLGLVVLCVRNVSKTGVLMKPAPLTAPYATSAVIGKAAAWEKLRVSGLWTRLL